MIRVFGLQLLFFLLPFLVYGFYLYFSGRNPTSRDTWSKSAVYWLAIIGLVLTIVSFVLLAVSARSATFAGGIGPEYGGVAETGRSA